MDSEKPDLRPKQKIQKVEISVDTCAELGGQVYNVIAALESVYQICGLRSLRYVDSLQGFREKSDGTNPETLFAMGSPYSRYGKHLETHRNWCDIVETHECREFERRLATQILPEISGPMIQATKQYAHILREAAHAYTSEDTDRAEHTANEVLLGIHQVDRRDKRGRLHFTDPAVEDALEDTKEVWRRIAKENDILGNTRKNGQKGRAVELIRAVQEFESIAYALLYNRDPALAAKAGLAPDFIRHANGVPPLPELREKAHHMVDVDLSRIPDYWHLPEVQQAARFTELWPWANRRHLSNLHNGQLDEAHKDRADKAAISYFFNTVCKKEDAAERLYLLVTHDGPLIKDFVKFVTGYEKSERKMKPHGKQKQTILTQLTEEDFAARGLPFIDRESQAKCSVLTGGEFVEFIQREAKRVRSKVAPSVEVNQALDRLQDEVDLLRSAVRKDVQAYGIIRKEGTFAARLRTMENLIERQEGRS